jgi:hypothetical protein
MRTVPSFPSFPERRFGLLRSCYTCHSGAIAAKSGLVKAMQMKNLYRKSCLAACLSVFLSFSPAFGQSSSAGPTVLSPENYSHLLDRLFPRVHPPSLRLDWLLVLRFEPNHGPESQLSIRAWHDGRAEVYFDLIQGSSAWSEANAYIARTGQQNLDAITSSIKTTRSVLSLPRSTLERWHQLFFRAIGESQLLLEKSDEEFRKSGERAAVLDGDRYTLWYMQGESEFSWSFSDVPINDVARQGMSPLVKWMATVRSTATERK